MVMTLVNDGLTASCPANADVMDLRPGVGGAFAPRGPVRADAGPAVTRSCRCYWVR